MNLRIFGLGIAASLLLASQVFAFGPSCGCEPVVAPACCAPAHGCGHHGGGLLSRLHRGHGHHGCCNVEPVCGCEVAPAPCFDAAPACCEPACGRHHCGLLARLKAHCAAKHSCCEPACGCEVVEPVCGCEVAPAPCCESACGHHGHHGCGLFAKLKARCHAGHGCCAEPTCGCEVVEASCGVETACCN
ncbi:MAG TPA: hypothetical protein VGN57_03310 [Pirellulaceae bacterium]|jgi:hypothetical protein|nr:hypothetical protein [Pirellulaceae bacterium]